MEFFGTLKAPVVAALPAAGMVGRIVRLLTDNHIYHDNGTAWDDLSAIGSGLARSVVVTSGNFTAGATALTDYVYLIAGLHIGTLPTAVANSNMYTFKNNHSVNITLGTTASQTIDGTTTISISPESSVDVISDGGAWRVI